ncbi:LysR substrate-binding domain-containing protein [Mesorhizobium sp.]|uniref:LysR substrate-binding domain-containing protein n=1 Tax=Mesorhizobium sp. TaxID=1871066 RepID=UPI0011F48E8A|nr:LysR substrate-binding domain-containing protein [Mesorhizobium sp.]TIV60195.1 MAG: LysR family transcriptional regulator [Mesorhizobium sp.]
MARRDLPPLNALRAFEVAARHQSFIAAADELNVSAGAVSRYVKLLEQGLGVQLFRRSASGVSLTNDGAKYASKLNDIFGQIEAATSDVRGADHSPVLVVSTSPMFMKRCLLSRLDRFRNLNPAIELRLDFHHGQIPSVRTGVDVYVMHSDGDHPGFELAELFGEDLFPVCSPRLVQGRELPLSPSDLIKHKLLHDIYMESDWRDWLAAVGVDMPLDPGLRFALYDVVIQAAVDGLGVAMGHSAFVSDELASGTLVVPNPTRIRSRDRFYIATLPGATRSRKVRAFRDWMLKEFQQKM